MAPVTRSRGIQTRRLASVTSTVTSTTSTTSIEPVTRRRGNATRPIACPPIRKNVKIELTLMHNKACMLCGHKQISEKLYGLLYQLGDVVVHHYCILLSSMAVQSGTDNQGIWGFSSKNIKTEIARGAKQVCFYCNKKGATILCSGKKCRKVFHLPCGLKNGSMHQYFQSFESFCQTHRVTQTVNPSSLKKSTAQCAICKDAVKAAPTLTSIWAPCCKHDAWFHRDCIQDLALNAGYFFKCPLCNDVQRFKSCMLELGIYIPSRDASWETVPGAFAELTERSSECSIETCLCPHAEKRKFQQPFGSWHILLCNSCGSNGTHRLCGSLIHHDQEWCCAVCREVPDEDRTKRSKSKPEPLNNCNESSESSSSMSGGPNRDLVILGDTIVISDSEDSNDSNDSVQCISDDEDERVQQQTTQQNQLPQIASYASLNCGIVFHVNENEQFGNNSRNHSAIEYYEDRAKRSKIKPEPLNNCSESSSSMTGEDNEDGMIIEDLPIVVSDSEDLPIVVSDSEDSPIVVWDSDDSDDSNDSIQVKMASSSRSNRMVLAAAAANNIKDIQIDPGVHSKVVSDDNYDSHNIITEINNKVFQQIMKQKHSIENTKNIVTPEVLEILTSLASSTSCSRDTKEWLPPVSKIVEDYHSDSTFLGSKFPSCSRNLFGVDDSQHDTEMEEEPQHLNQTTNVDAPIENIVDETTQVGRDGLRPPKKTNIRMMKKYNKVNGKNNKLKPNPCINMKCQNKCAAKFTENERQNVFNEYWALIDSRQKDFLLKCVREVGVKRQRVQHESRRNLTREYYLPKGSDSIQVCRQFILSTLDISRKHLQYTIENSSPFGTAKRDERGKGWPKNKTSDKILSDLDDFIQKLPAMKSHYCRASTTKKYLPCEFENIKRLYLVYKSYCTQNDLNFVSLHKFRNIFNTKYNIGFHVPKKDKCRMCSKFENTILLRELNENENQLQELHEIEKNECKEMFLFDQNLSKAQGNFLCISFDLQKVLNTPQGQNMNLYYSRKYSVFNCTVYESGTQNSYAYLWGESTGQRGANEIATCIFKYLCDLDKRNTYSSIALYCDSCSGQNKNRAMMAMIQYSLEQKLNFIKEIKLCFLLPGHTYMPVDSIHATIEHYTKNKSVWAPSEWGTLIRNARTNPGLIEVINLQYSEFLNWKELADSTYSSNLKSTNGNIIQTSKFRYLVFKKLDNGSVEVHTCFSYSSTGESSLLSLKKKPKKKKAVLTQCYKRPLMISLQKRNDLFKLCNDGIIPYEFHEEYFRMHSTDSNVPDYLVETDEEDEQNENEEATPNQGEPNQEEATPNQGEALELPTVLENN